MIRLAANLSFLFAELPLSQRFAAAARAGFGAVEWNFAYDTPTAELSALLHEHRLDLVLINTPPGDLAAGDLGLAVLAGREAEAEVAFQQALDQAVALGARNIHYMAGQRPPDRSLDAADAIFLANLRRDADRAAQVGVTLTVEPLNPRDRPRYHIVGVDHAVRLIRAAARPNIGLQFDLYHCQITGGDLIRTLERHIELIAHVQIAGVPDRGEPSDGEVAYGRVLSRLDALGYGGFVGCEYAPRRDTLSGLAWAAPYLAAGI